MIPSFDDTQPVVTIPSPEDAPPRRPWLGLGLLGGALLLTVAALLLLLNPAPTISQATTPQSVQAATVTVTDEAVLMLPAITQVAVVQPLPAQAVPTLNSERVAALLQTPIVRLQADTSGNALRYDPFTFIPERPRSEMIQYTAVSGDTIDAISQRYTLKAETLAWCNDRSIVFVLRPGDVLTIPPVDGACHVVLGTRQETITSVAEQYKVSAQDLINSPYGSYYDMAADTILPGGINMFIPNGQGELISWNPPSEVETNADGSIRTVSFAKGLAGSCGAVDPGGGAAWGNPLPNGTWVRGFSVGHPGIDLSASPGTPIYAANSGPVLFSGFSNWGFGEAVVLGHGPFSTLYGHMSARYAACGGYLNVGQVVGLVGSTGNSTGPHLHFEIRFNDQSQNPSGTPGIGW